MGLMVAGGGAGSGQYKSLVPPLTSISQNGYKVSASSVYSSMTQDDVVKCFDGKTEDVVGSAEDYRDRMFLNASNTNQTITVELPQAKEARMIVVLYTSTAKYGVGRAKAISVSGSNDGARYTPLTGYAPYNCGSVFMRSEVDTTKYKYYKIDLTRESEYIGIIEVILLGK